MTLALCVDGVADEQLIAAASQWMPHAERIEVWCGYGDLAMRELEHQRGRHGRPPPPHGPDLDRTQAEAVCARALEMLRARGVQATSQVFGGRDPGHAIAAASAPDITLLLGAGHRGGVGPKSIGHVARFIIDHAAGPVIVARL